MIMPRQPTLCSSISQELFDKIDAMAKNELRSVSSMSGVLLAFAVREKERKKKKIATKNNSENNTADMGEGHSEG